MNANELEERDRLHNMIRGGILGMRVDMATRQALLAEMDRLSPRCAECNTEMHAETFQCSECGPTA